MNNNMVLALFQDRNDADRAIDDLKGNGYNVQDISIVTKETSENTQDNNSNNIAGGAAAGAGIGALAGLLAGLAAIAIPGIGALFVAGPIAAAWGLTGAAATAAGGALTGALAGGLIGALVNLGVPEEEAREYERQIKEGAVLLAVPENNQTGTDLNEILQRNHASQIRRVTVNR